MNQIIHDVSIIIGYRQASADRKLGLQFVLNWLYKYLPEVEVLLIEQDETHKTDVVLPPNCKYHFIYNPGLYNRCWAFNVGARLTKKNILAFGDSDVFLLKDDYLKVFEECTVYEAVTPNKRSLFNVINANADTLSYEISENRKLFTFAGGLLVMQRYAFEKIGGWDERFEGWGAEDNAISHLIHNTVTNKVLDQDMYHVDHERGIFDGNTQPGYEFNKMIADEIMTLSGISLSRYLEKYRKISKGDPDKYKNPKETPKTGNLHFVLAITTYNRKKYIEEIIDSWLITRSNDVKWTVIIADDGSVDGTLEYLDNISIDGVSLIINKNKRLGIAGQTNSIISKLSDLNYNVCFCCNDDILFTKAGWDLLYWDVLTRTGYEHLVYFDARWKEMHNLPEPKTFGQLCNYCLPENIQGCFFTLTPEVIKTVGYFDMVNFGFRGLAHVDFTWRCCRAGFNLPDSPCDVLDSNEYIKTQRENYIYSIPGPIQTMINPDWVKQRKWNIIRKNRIFIPKNELNVMPEILEKHEKGEDISHLIRKPKKTAASPFVESSKSDQPGKVVPTNDAIPSGITTEIQEHAIQAEQNINKEPEKSPVVDEPTIKGNQNIPPIIEKKNIKFVYLDLNKPPVVPPESLENTLNKAVYHYAKDKGSISKKLYNFLIHNRIHFIIRGMDIFANKLIKTGYNIKNIDS